MEECKKDEIYLLISIITIKYGRNFLINRSECLSISKFSDENSSLLNSLSNEMLKFNFQIYILNLSIEYFVFSNKFILLRNDLPVNAFFVVDKNNLILRKGDPWETKSHFESSKYDLHDFCHYVCSLLSAELYGSKHFNLDEESFKMIYDINYTSENGILISDTIIFSNFLDFYYHKIIDENDSFIIKYLSELICDYLLGKIELYHSNLQKLVKLDNRVKIDDLMILLQNKYYELPASQIEQLFFIRSSPPSENKDNLPSSSSVDLINYINNNGNKLLFYEKRNLVKHISQITSYIKLSNIINSSLESEKIQVERVIRKINFNSFDNLFLKGF